MLTVCSTCRAPADHVPGGPETMAAWAGWFESLGDRLADRGNPVVEPADLGNRGETVFPGSYSGLVAVCGAHRSAAALADAAGQPVACESDRVAGLSGERTRSGECEACRVVMSNACQNGGLL